jgi:hypothetical protein
MVIPRYRLRSLAFLAVAAFACATATAISAGTLTGTLADSKDAPAYVSACSIDSDGSGVFTPTIAVTDRKPSAVASADVAIDFYDPQNHLLGESVVSPPYGPQGEPFGAFDHIACRVTRAEFVDGSVYVLKGNSGNLLAPLAGALLGAGAAAALIGASHSSKSSSSSASSSPTPAAGSSATPVPVESIVPLARRKK